MSKQFDGSYEVKAAIDKIRDRLLSLTVEELSALIGQHKCGDVAQLILDSSLYRSRGRCRKAQAKKVFVLTARCSKLKESICKVSSFSGGLNE